MQRAWPMILLFVLSAGGCGTQVREDAAGATISFGTGTYVGLVLFPLTIAAVAAYLIVSRDTGKRVVGLVMIGFVALISVGLLPGIWRDRVTLDAQSLTQRTGFWWSPTVKGFKTADVREIRITRKPSRTDGRMETVWELHEKDGATRDVDPGDLWDNATEYLIPKLQARGITVTDER